MLMMWSVWPLLIESALILLQTVPTHIDIEKLKRKLLENIDGILAVSLYNYCNQCRCGDYAIPKNASNC